MVTYKLVFDTKGNVHYQHGQQPPYMHRVIDGTIRNSTGSGECVVQDSTLAYRRVGEMVYVCIDGSVDDVIDEYHRGSTGDRPPCAARPAVPNSKPKKKRQWTGSEQELDYSTTSTTSYIDHLASRPASMPARVFDMSRIRTRIASHYDRNVLYDRLLGRNVSPDVIDHVLKHSRSMQDVRDALRSIVRTKRACTDRRVNYKMALVGTNGVGKSSTLSKLCYFYLSRGMSVYVGACDTFRAGAIEQLRTYVQRYQLMYGHDVRNANDNDNVNDNNNDNRNSSDSKYGSTDKMIDLYQQGYNKDDCKIARSTLQNGRQYDVVMVDTSGRTSTHKHMSSLRRLTGIGFDDVVYVTEALKGYDKDICSFDMITCVIVTKIDTVGDKMGSIVNACWYSGKPVMFVGCGQSNVDLIELDVEKMIDVLLSE